MIYPLKVFLVIIITIVISVIFLLIKEYSDSSKQKNMLPKEKSDNGLTKDIQETNESEAGQTNFKKTSGGSEGDGGFSSGGGSSGSSEGSGGVSSGGSSSSTTYTTDLTVCTNAQNGYLCDGLDLTYGEGYETACCSERSLCC